MSHKKIKRNIIIPIFILLSLLNINCFESDSDPGSDVSDNYEWKKFTVPVTGRERSNWDAAAVSADGKTMLAGLSGGDLYISRNNGISWAVADIGVVDDDTHDEWEWFILSEDGTVIVARVNNDCWISKDNGYNWKKSELEYVEELSMSSDGAKITAAAYHNDSRSIYTSEDSGDTWSKRKDFTDSVGFNSGVSSSDRSVQAVITTFSDDNYIYNHIYISTDNGVTWNEKKPVDKRYWRKIFISPDGTEIIAVNDNEIYKTGDSGATWNKQFSSDSIDYSTSIASSSDLSKLVSYGDTGEKTSYIYTSSDSGATWIKRTGAGLRSWSEIIMSSDGSKIIAAAQGEASGDKENLYISSDSGLTWSAMTAAGKRDWEYNLFASSDCTEILAFDRDAESVGYIYSSSDSGLNWIEHNDLGDTRKKLKSFSFASDGISILAADANNIYITVDNCNTWTTSAFSHSGEWSGIASSSDGKTLAVIEKKGYIYRSADGGNNWEKCSSAGQRYWSGIVSSFDGKVLAVLGEKNTGWGTDYDYSDKCYDYIYVSDDSGVTWREIAAPAYHNWTSVAVSADGETLIAADSAYSRSGSVCVSKDLGNTWEREHIDDTGCISALVCSSDGKKIVAAEWDGHIYISTDEGKTFKKRKDSGKRDWKYISGSADLAVIAAVTDDKKEGIIISSDGGEKWSAEDSTRDNYWEGIIVSSDGKSFAGLQYNSSSIYYGQ